MHQRVLRKLDKEVAKSDKTEHKTGFSSEKKSFTKELCSLAKNKAFILLTFALSGLYFIVTGVQYWLPDYLKTVLKIDPVAANLFYSIMSLCAPVLGVVIGGIIISKLGGYNDIRAQKSLMVMGGFAVLAALPIPFLDTFWVFGICIWVLLFFGGAIVPPLIGVMINSVGEYQKASANSISNSL